MKVFKSLLPVLFALAYYSLLVTAHETGTGSKGLAKQRIELFEKLIKESEAGESPELKVVKRTKPYISKFPIDDGVSTQVDKSGEVSIHDKDSVDTDKKDEPVVEEDLSEGYSGPEVIPVSSFVDPISSDIEDDGEMDHKDQSTAAVTSVHESDVDYESKDESSAQGALVEAIEDSSVLSQGDKSETVSTKASGIPDKLQKKLDKKEAVLKKKQEKEKLIQDKKEKKLKLKLEKEKAKKEKAEKEKAKKEKAKKDKAEKEMAKKEKAEKEKAEKEMAKKEKAEKEKAKKEMAEKEKAEKEKAKKEKTEKEKAEKEMAKREKAEKEKAKKEKAEKEKAEKEITKKEKAEKEKKLKKEKKNKKEKTKVEPELAEEYEDKSSCSSSKGSKKVEMPTRSHSETLEERLSNQEEVVSDISSDIQDDISTVVSENDLLGDMNSIDSLGEGDNLVNRPVEDSHYSEDEDDAEIKARILAGNETDFNTERMSSEEALQESDSDYLDTEEHKIEPREKYVFDEESEDIISKENAVKPQEGIEIEGISEDEDDASNVSEASTDSNYYVGGENENQSSQHSYDDSIESSNNSASEVPENGANSVLEEEIDIKDPENDVDDEFSAKYSKADDDTSKEKSKSLFGRIKSFFNNKPLRKLNCKTPSCMKRLSKKDEPKFSSNFVPKIYQLSRDVPTENFYRIPEILSSLRSESNRLVFAYQLMDGSLIPSSTLALSSKSFIVRRWGKNVQNKLTKLRAEFDNLKARLSSMYHEGVLKGEFELLIEEMDDLTIMLYLLAKEFPRKNKFANIARDFLRYPEVVSTPGEKLISMFRRPKTPKCVKKPCEPKPKRSESDVLAIKILKKRMKFIKKRLNSLSK